MEGTLWRRVHRKKWQTILKAIQVNTSKKPLKNKAKMNIKALKKFNIPDKPGVYFFLKGKEILYVGKATSLKSRVKSYFGRDLIETRGPVTVEMVFKAENIKWEVADSVLEALIQEANLIKKYQPHY